VQNGSALQIRDNLNAGQGYASCHTESQRRSGRLSGNP